MKSIMIAAMFNVGTSGTIPAIAPKGTIAPKETICDLIRIILTMNNFTFNSKHYLQKQGKAMGTKMAPSYANLFLGKFEHDALLNSPYQPHG